MPGRRSTGAPLLPPSSSGGASKRKRRASKRTLDALAIAEAEHPRRVKIKSSRLGDSEDLRSSLKRRQHKEDDDEGEGEEREGKRPRRGERDRFGNEVEGGSDSSGNEWVVGAGEDDSEVDSEEAFGEGDEEKFGGFSFGGEKRSGRDGEVDLDEGDDGGRGGGEEEGEESDGFAEDAVDLAAVLDEEEESGDEDVEGDESELEEEQSVLSFSEDENDAGDQEKLASLQALVSTMNDEDKTSSRRPPAVDAQESATPSEFGVQPKRKLAVADLLPSVTDPKLRKSLKLLDNDKNKSSSKRGIAKKLDAPLPKRQQDKLDRAAAGVKSKETLDEWIDTVKHNRRAEHLSFPLKNPNATVAPGTKTLLTHEELQPVTELEKAIQSILEQSGMGPANGKTEEQQIMEAEELQMSKMPLAEVELRRAELRRRRSLLFREEIRAKRIKKIKSKSYRKVHRKERERNTQVEKDALAEAGVEESDDEKERNDRRRAEERMGARHRDSKWAKGMKNSGRAMWDDDARDGVMEMARRGEELKRRIEGKEVNGSGDDVSTDEDYEDDDEDINDDKRLRELAGLLEAPANEQEGSDPGAGGLAVMKFMKKAEAAQRARNDEDAERLRRDLAGEHTPSEADDEEGQGRRSYGPKKEAAKRKAINPFSTANKSELEETRNKSDGEDESGFQGFEDENEMEIITETPQNSKTSISARKLNPTIQKPPSDPPPATDLASNPWLSTSQTSTKKSKHRPEDSRAGAIISNNIPSHTEPKASNPAHKPKQPSTAHKSSKQQPTNTNNIIDDDTSDSGSSSPNSNSPNKNNPLLPPNSTLINLAFATDDTTSAQTFAAEKSSLSALERPPSPTSTALPGWGSWTGPGLSRKMQKRAAHQQARSSSSSTTTKTGPQQTKRKDANNPKVIISQARMKKTTKYLAKQLPFPFETREQYERGLRMPVGGEWNAKMVFQGMTEPRVKVRRGEVVRPIERGMV